MSRRLRQIFLLCAALILLASLLVTKAQDNNGEDEIDAVDWSPSGSLIAIARGQFNCGQDMTMFPVIVIDVKTQRVSKQLIGHTCEVLSLAWSFDSTKLASTGVDGRIITWDYETGVEISQFRNSLNRTSITWKSSGWELASLRIATGAFDVIDAENGKYLRSYIAPSGNVVSIDWMPNGTKIASGGNSNDIYIWDESYKDPSHPIASLEGHEGMIYTLRWSPDGTHIASGSADNTIRIWDAATGDTLKVIDTPVNVLKWHPSGLAIASGDNQSVSIWNAQTGALIQSFRSPIGRVNDLDWSPDGTQLVYVGQHTGSNGEHLQIIPAPAQLLTSTATATSNP